jgi:dolichol-phosphate mannosyltransferase
VNRIVNRCVQWLFWSPYNDLTNAFKAYRTSVIRECGPFRASHFNITLEMSLAVLCRRYNVAQIPISWYGRTWGSSNLRLREMGRKYLCTVLMSFFQKMLISDDLMAERLATHTRDIDTLQSIQDRLNQLEVLLQSVDKHDVAVHSVASDSSLGKPESSTALSGSEPVGIRQPHAEVTLQTSEASR